ncbi:Ectonucleotide pyrophosphatase/phosphodiesterase member 5 [Bulinus truncatus]|nr:Ectonucleotide pyrophosphatase/phosphodiesterase member 5 [Bulinus truncatus]
MKYQALLTSILQLTFISRTSCEKSKVLLVSMDGFRYDYLNKINKVSNFQKLTDSGVTMPYMNSSFVTKTFPCHYSIATGLHPEVHGIVSNKMFDPEFNKTFSMKSTEPFWWQYGEPIWITAVKAKLKAGVFFWPGSESKIQGLQATGWRPYNNSTPFELRVSTVVQWLAKDNFDLVLLYFNEPDSAGHANGPNGEQVVKAIERMNDILGQLMEELQREGIKEKVNVMVTSDHGMTSIDVDNKLIDISEIVDSSILKSAVDEGPTANLIPQPNKSKELVEALSKVDHLHVMLKEDIPERFHLKNNKRVMPVFAYADEGWLITTNATKRRAVKYYGDHGYDNDLLSMKPLFIASGPDFKTGGQRVEPIQSVDIYPLICHLLDIPAAPNNGSLERAKSLLRDSFNKCSVNQHSFFVSIVTCYIVLFLFN